MAHSIHDLDENDQMAVVRQYLRRAGVLLAVADEAMASDEERLRMLRDALGFARAATSGLAQLHDQALARVAVRQDRYGFDDDTDVGEVDPLRTTAPVGRDPGAAR